MIDDNEWMRYPTIDVHGHCGEYAGFNASEASMMNAEAHEIAMRARSCAISMTIVSELGAFDPRADRPVDVDAANRCAQQAAEHFEDLWFYAVLNPKLDGWELKAEILLEHPKCVGAKLHPNWNFWSLDEYGDRVFSFLDERSLVVLTHTGSIGTEPYRFIPFANKYSGVKLILAHLGYSETATYDLQTKAIQESSQGNVWVDTSSQNSIVGRNIELAVDRIGADRILFGTDTPLYFAAMQKARIAYAFIPEEAKRRILYSNAADLLGLPCGTEATSDRSQDD